MLEFKPRQPEATQLETRWSMGVNRRHVAVYVALAVIGGFALGIATARYITHPESMSRPFAGDARQPLRPAPTDNQPGEFHNVTRVLRADTIEVAGVGPVRMLGIETPDGKSPREIYAVHGERAVSYVEKALLGQAVRLEYDTTSANAKDESGQTLAYVYTRDGVLINGEMVRLGLAFVRGGDQFRMVNDFRGFERDAMQAMRGVWGPSSPVVPTAVAASPTPADEKAKKLAPLPPSAFGANIPALSNTPPNSLEPSVWVSPSDKMYHKPACTFLDKKKHSLSLSQAKAEGYTACSRCYASTLLKAP